MPSIYGFSIETLYFANFSWKGHRCCATEFKPDSYGEFPAAKVFFFEFRLLALDGHLLAFAQRVTLLCGTRKCYSKKGKNYNVVSHIKFT